MIGLATRKKGDELIAHFHAMLKGQSLTNLGPVPDPFEQEVEQVRSDLNIDQEKGGWWLTFRPVRHTGVRWSKAEELEQLIAKHSVRIYNEFPAYQRGTFGMGWGIANDRYGETWALTKSGLFGFWKEFRENEITAERTGYRGGAEAQRPVPPKEWVEISWSIGTVVDFFMFQSSFVEEFGPGQEMLFSFKIGPLAGRKLLSLKWEWQIGYGEPEPCRAPFFLFHKTIDAETLRSNWEQTCTEVLKELIELFPNHRISQETLLKLVEKYKTRRM